MIYTQHPLSAAFPAMPADELAALQQDIAASGQREPAVAIGTEILDGWHRPLFCQALGRAPWVVEFDGDDPVAFVKSKNLHRRHLSQSQRAMAIVECNAWAARGRPAAAGLGETLNRPSGPVFRAAATEAEMASEADVGHRTIRRAKVVAEKATPEVREAVRDGSMSLRGAEATLKPTSAKKQPAQRAAMDPADSTTDDDAGGADLLDELERAQKEIAGLLALIKAAEADDLKAEVIKWRRAYEDAARKQSEAMDAAKRAEAREGWLAKQLRRCGKAVGEVDPDKVAPKVEAFVRAHSKVEA